jgi:hypothetical protein
MTKLVFSGSASRGGSYLMLVSGALLLLLVAFTVLLAETFSWLLAICYIGSFMGLFIGWAKLAEPKYSLVCDADGVHYMHRLGSWLLPWDAFAFSAVPSIDGQELAFIGFKVTHYDVILKQIPLRLAVKIMTEQRPLYYEVIKQSCASGQCASELLSEKDYFKTAHEQYNGIKAVFAQRMQKFGQACGFELLVPVNIDVTTARDWSQQINKLRLAQLHPDN